MEQTIHSQLFRLGRHNFPSRVRLVVASPRSPMIRIGAPFMTTNRHSTEFQEQALSKVRQRGTRSVQVVASDLNMAVGTSRKWLSKSNRKGEVGKPVSDLPVD